MNDHPASTAGTTPRKSGIKKLVITILLLSLGVHIAAGLIAGIVVVARYFTTPPAVFQATRDIRLPAKKREQRMNMAAFDAAAPKPTFSDRMQSTRPTAFSLPDLPKMAIEQPPPLDPSQLINENINSLGMGEGSGTGSGTGAAGAGGFGGSGMSFLGVRSTGKRILLVFDVSTSVVNKASGAGIQLEKIQEETLALIAKLPITSRFGMVQFTQNYKPFNKELLPATDPNRAAASEWVKSEWVTAGTMGVSSKVTANPRGFAGVLELAAAMKPDVLYVISDGSFQWKPGGNIDNIPWSEIKKIIDGPLQEGQKCIVNFIAFQPRPEDLAELKRISGRTGGKTIELKK
ncbi:MAG: hypothetical protein WCG66_04685 [bacterium]